MAGSLDFSWLNLDVPERRYLDRQPVVLVLMAIRFHPVLKVDQQDFIATFQDAIRHDFPVFRRAPAPPPIQVQMPGVVLDPTADIPPGWHFQDVNRTWTVTLSRNSLGFETRSYAGYEDFRVRLTPVLDALIKHVVPTLGTRVGLRFLDELRQVSGSGSDAGTDKGKPGNSDWNRIVRPELLGIAGMPEFQGRIQQSLQQLALRDKHDVGINITHGIVPGGSMIEPPSTVSQEHQGGPFYALDIDAFQEVERGKEFAVNTNSILDRLGSFHDAISQIFRWALDEEYLKSL